MSETTQESLDESVVTEEVVPFLIVEICSNDGGPSSITLLHELEKDIGLLGSDVQVAHFIDNDTIDSRQML